MPDDLTIPQGGPERQISQAMSLEGRRPPVEVPGYDFERLLGSGAYGEVWVAIERNTGRRVAIKFYAHRGGLDWSLLSREVEKLAFLCADRYVVQLIAVGWDATPPYYVMEYMERGSLADRLASGPLPVAEAVRLFREVAIGLLHAHGKGVLHCDLKPANVLLDQDDKPRLADFGQSRLSHEQLPALGTLFYMAPEQADLAAVPDARWDVYALGALLYCMLTGKPPHRDEEAAQAIEQITDLRERLRAYREWIRRSGIPTDHRQIPGVDRELAQILERCLAPDPNERFPNVQSVLAALDAWTTERTRRPLVILGFVGPALLLVVFTLFAWRGFLGTVAESRKALTRRALENNRLMAQYVADLAGKELRRRFEAVEQLAANQRFQELVLQAFQDSKFRSLAEELSREGLQDSEAEPLRREFRNHPLRAALQRGFATLIPPWMQPSTGDDEDSRSEVASWFFCDARGLSTVRVPESDTIGRNYAFRSFFTGRDADLPRGARPPPQEHLRKPKLSAVFPSDATKLWIVAVAAPVFDHKTGEFLGVVALTVPVTRFVELEGSAHQFPVLVEMRPGDHTGMILQHPLFDHVLKKERQLPERFAEERYRLKPEQLPRPVSELTDLERGPAVDFVDPLGKDPLGEAYRRRFLAQTAPIQVPGSPQRAANSGWIVLVQEDYHTAIALPLEGFQHAILRYGIPTAGLVLAILLGLWTLTLRLLREIRRHFLSAGLVMPHRSEAYSRPTVRGLYEGALTQTQSWPGRRPTDANATFDQDTSLKTYSGDS